MASALPSIGALPPLRPLEAAAADITLHDTGTTTDTHPAPTPAAVAAAVAAAAAVVPACEVERAALATLASLVPRPTVVWDSAVAQAVTTLGHIVKDYIDVTAIRVRPTYDAVIDALRDCGRDDKVPGFQAAWDELCSTPDGRAVVAVCQTAAAGDELLGRMYLTRKAADPQLEAKLHRHYAGAAFLPVLLAAGRYYRAHAAPPTTTESARPEWPSLDALLPGGLPDDGTPPTSWLLAVAPALTVAERIVEPYMDLAKVLVPPSYESIVTIMQNLELDKFVPRFHASWQELRSTPEGRAVIAVCAAAQKTGVVLGWYSMPPDAGAINLKRTLKKLYRGAAFLPVLLAAARYYLKHTAAAAAAAAAGVGGEGGATSAGTACASGASAVAAGGAGSGM